MNHDFDDPNNHVPAIRPGDEWGDLDVVSERARMGLPTKRVDRGLPPKKEIQSPQVNHHSPGLKIDPELDAPNPFYVDSRDKEKNGEGLAEASAASSNLPAKKPWKPMGKQSGETPQRSLTSFMPKEPDEGHTAIPQAQPANRFRVNEIDPTIETPAARPAKMVPMVASGDAEGLGNGDALKLRRFSRGERSEWGENDTKDSPRWMIYTGFSVVCLVVLAVVMSQLPGWRRNSSVVAPDVSRLATDDGKLPESSEDMKSLELLSGSREKAKIIYAAYACAKEVGNFIAFVHAPDRNRELIEQNWKPLAMEPGWLPGDQSVWTVIERNGMRYALLEGILADFTNFSAVFRMDGDDLKIDWKATTGYGTADFAEMKKGEGNGKEVRAWVSLADFYTFSYPEGKYRSYRVMSANAQLNLWGYVLSGSKLDQDLQNLFLPSPITGESPGQIQLTLCLEPGNGDSLPDQWIISGIRQLSWLDD